MLLRLDKHDHKVLVLWTTECAEHVLPYFEENHPEDDRPRDAIEAGRAWVRGEIATGEARAAALAAHAAATEAAAPSDSPAAAAKERDWHYRRLPEYLRSVAFPAGGND